MLDSDLDRKLFTYLNVSREQHLLTNIDPVNFTELIPEVVCQWHRWSKIAKALHDKQNHVETILYIIRGWFGPLSLSASR